MQPKHASDFKPLPPTISNQAGEVIMCICQHFLINVLIAGLPKLTPSLHEKKKEVLSADCDPSKIHSRTLKQTMLD